MKEHTKQGVRNLNHLPSPKRERLDLRTRYGPLNQCPHRRMRGREQVYYCKFDHCQKIGGWYDCPDCGLFYEYYD